jgi:hypothetical protein
VADESDNLAWDLKARLFIWLRASPRHNLYGSMPNGEDPCGEQR